MMLDLDAQANLIAQATAIMTPCTKEFEHCELCEYPDIEENPTIGWGRRIKHGQYPNGITQAQADLWLEDDVWSVLTRVIRLVTRPGASPNEIAMMGDLAYNIGIEGFETSTLLRLYNAGNKAGAAAEFVRWCHAGGKEVDGLLRRRKCETLIFQGKTIAEMQKLNWLE